MVAQASDIAYVDTSSLVRVVLQESGYEHTHERLSSYHTLLSSPLLEAEFLATLRREALSLTETRLPFPLTWVHPSRSIRAELEKVLSEGYVRGADLWHLATALYLAPNTGELVFVTEDLRQREVAAKLGFLTAIA